jgi:exonuclease III
VLSAAKRAKVDVLLLQETHFYENSNFHRVGFENVARYGGWKSYHAPASKHDRRGGTAVLIRTDSKTVKVVDGAQPKRDLGSRFVSIACDIESNRTHIASIYLPAEPGARRDALKIIKEKKFYAKTQLLVATLIASTTST